VNANPLRDRSAYVMILGLTLVVLIQATLIARIHVFGAAPDLLLVVVVCWSLLAGVTQGLIAAFTGGIAVDVVAGLPLGSSSLALMPLCFLAQIGRSSVYQGNTWLPVLLVAIATPLEGWLILLTRQLRGAPIDWIATTTRVILPAIALNVVLTLIVMPVLRRISAGLRMAPVAG
jgi:rod shape-determining protein MreD